jgi:ABC-type sugar transport system substrate-binding protein
MNRRLTVVAVAMLLAAGLVFAGGGAESKPAAAKGGTVALMWGGTDAPFVGPHIRSFTATMEKAGYKVVVPDSKWDPAKQSTDVDDMVAQKIDLICLVPVEPVACAHDDYPAAGVIVALKEAGYKPGQVQIVGVGGAGDALQAIEDGWMYGIVPQSPITEGEFKAKRALEYLRTGKLDPFYQFMDNPKIDAST